MNTAFIISLALTTMLLGVGHGAAVLPDDCPAPLPCRCQSSVIVCVDAGLVEVPTFKPSSRQFSRLLLSRNDITTIPAGAFKAISAKDYFILDMDFNKIGHIENGAFEGIAEQVKILELGSNKLSEMPLAIHELSRLMSLTVYGNPMKSLVVPSSLTSLTVKSQEIYNWPSLDKLSQITNLDLEFPIINIPDGAFNAMSRKLNQLTINQGKFQSLPSSLGSLQRIQSLSIINNPYLNLGDMSVIYGLKNTLWALDLTNVNMQVVPDVFANLPRLYHLQLAGNPITYIDDATIPEDLPLRFLGLSTCKLERYPSAISALTSLTTLYMDNNEITTLETGDFQGLTKLRSLDLTSNPLEYISPDAFQDLDSLQVLVLSKTKLTTLPKAIKDIVGLSYLDLSDTLVECTCDMVWLLEWAGSEDTNILGNCFNINKSIAVYIKTLKSC